MSWLSYIFPRTITKLSSSYNKEIRINEEKGKLKLLVNGSRQSGEQISTLWKKAFRAFRIPQDYQVRSVLVLGVGGGSVIYLLREYYPEAKIVGLDIDQTMIEIGKKYFGLDQVKNLSFVCQDAEQFVAKKKKFDLVVVDLFIGTDVPELVRRESFLKNLKASLTKNGAVVINYLREFEYGQKSESLKKSLSALFPQVAEKSISSNRFFLVSMVK
ncbi:class I SAM-dependent methyltransferase [Candidatus Gottesmanbacteria bacterium]|nr:class I SAM-dependent methyltransferase [Candidatus Gottesmanbacteria bacterium]